MATSTQISNFCFKRPQDMLLSCWCLVEFRDCLWTWYSKLFWTIPMLWTMTVMSKLSGEIWRRRWTSHSHLSWNSWRGMLTCTIGGSEVDLLMLVIEFCLPTREYVGNGSLLTFGRIRRTLLLDFTKTVIPTESAQSNWCCEDCAL